MFYTAESCSVFHVSAPSIIALHNLSQRKHP